jgi:hypothetical protein
MQWTLSSWTCLWQAFTLWHETCQGTPNNVATFLFATMQFVTQLMRLAEENIFFIQTDTSLQY